MAGALGPGSDDHFGGHFGHIGYADHPVVDPALEMEYNSPMALSQEPTTMMVFSAGPGHADSPDHAQAEYPEIHPDLVALGDMASGQQQEQQQHTDPEAPHSPNVPAASSSVAEGDVGRTSSGAASDDLQQQQPATTAANHDNGTNALFPFVASAQARLTEAEWQLLMRVTSELFMADLEAVAESGESHKTKGQLMQDALSDPRIVESPTDYTLS